MPSKRSVRPCLRRAAVAVLLAGAAGRTALGQTLESGSRSFGVFGLAGQGFHLEGQGFSEFGAAAITAARGLSRHIEAVLEYQPIIVIRQPTRLGGRERETVEATAFDIGIRWFPGPAAWKWRPYVEVLDGVFGATRSVPPTGTNFNFLTQVGAGLALPFGRQWHPNVFYRWYHISNASLGRHNPDWDHWSIGVGFRMNLPPARR
jgi:hypothetical protein